MAEHRPLPHSLEGNCRARATDSEALIQSRRLIQSDKVKGEISVERALPLGTQQWPHLLDHEAMVNWTQGVPVTTRIYVLTDQGVVRHINGFIVDNVKPPASGK